MCIGNISVSSTLEADVFYGVWRLCKRNSRNLYLETIGRHIVFGTEESVWTCRGKSERAGENCLMSVVNSTFQ